MTKSKLSELEQSAAPKKRNDAYVVMLFITLLALGLGCFLMNSDFEEYGSKAPPKAEIPALKQLGTAPPVVAAEVAPKEKGMDPMGEDGKKDMKDKDGKDMKDMKDMKDGM